MKYLLMCCHEEKQFADMPKSEVQVIVDETMAYCEALSKTGTLIASEALEPVEMASTVRVRNGKVSVTDGPFAETKEQFGGFFLINAQRFERGYPGGVEVSIGAPGEYGSTAGSGVAPVVAHRTRPSGRPSLSVHHTEV